jgi:hypothetical protein
MNKVKVTKENSLLKVNAPYNADFVARAHQMGGEWAAPYWQFDARDEQIVKTTLMEIYKTDGSLEEIVSVRLTLEEYRQAVRAGLSVCGIPIARAYGRDSGTKIEKGIVLEAGGFQSAGSTRYWTTQVKEGGATVVIRDIPLSVAQAIVEQENAEIIREAEIDKEALRKEREALVARLAEIDKILG